MANGNKRAEPTDEEPTTALAPVLPIKPIGRGLGIGAGTLALAALATSHLWLLIPAGVLAVGFGALGVVPLPSWLGLLPAKDPTKAVVGMGATVQSGALLERGARVESGATVRSGAIIRAGAVVGMGATVESGAIIEESASIGWGATVRSGAIVRRGASVGSGSTVESGAVVDAGVRIGAGSTVAGQLRGGTVLPKTAASLQAAAAVSTAAIDPRDVRIDGLCDQFEAELKQLTGKVDEFLRDPEETVATVRRTCHDLLKRERELRRLANPADQERLNREAGALQERIATESDEVTRQRLQRAVEAIEDQRQQRALVLRDANRIEAEQTRLVWTMEGLVSHVIRLRTTQAGASTADLDRGLAQLRDEVSSVASAIEHVQSLDLAMAPFEPVRASEEAETRRERERS